MVTVNIKFDDREVQKKLADLERFAVQDTKKALNEVGEDLLDYFGTDIFKKQGTSSQAWKKLSAATLAARAAGYGYYSQTPVEGGKILVWTGRLKKSFTKKVEPSRLTIGNSAAYFRYHQLGGGKTPKRPMLSIDSNVIKTTVSTLQKYLTRAVNE